MRIDNLKNRLRQDAAEMCVKMNGALPLLLLNYPAESLALTLETAPAEVPAALEAAAVEIPGLRWEPFEGSVCLTLPAPFIEEAWRELGQSPFLRELIALSRNHHAIEEDYAALFGRFGKAAVEPSPLSEFSTLLYFRDGTPDPHYYCLAREGGHVTYHRFLPQDYRALVRDGEEA